MNVANILSSDELRVAGYRPLTLRWMGHAHDHPTFGACANFDVIGDVPSGPGLYAFTIDRGENVEVKYVGMSTHLWMVLKGRVVIQFYVTMTAGTLSGTNNIDVIEISGNGIVNLTGGTVSLDWYTNTGFGGNSAWTF